MVPRYICKFLVRFWQEVRGRTLIVNLQYLIAILYIAKMRPSNVRVEHENH